MNRRTPTPRKLALACSQQSGFGLLEVVLTLGAIAVISAGAFAVYKTTDANAAVRNETEALTESANAIERSVGLLGSYSSVSTALVERDGLAAERYSRSGMLANAWGGAVSFHPHAVRQAGDAFLVEYDRVPTRACAQLASSMARRAYDVRVGGASVMEGGRLDVPAAAAECSRADDARMGFVFHSGLVAGTAVAAPPLILPPSPPPPVSSTPSAGATPTGPVSQAGPAAGVTPVSSTPGAPVTAPPAVSPGAPASPVNPVNPPTPSTPPGSPGTSPACVVPPTLVQTPACPSGQTGSVTQTRPEQRTQTRSASCPAPTGNYTWGGWSAWSDWTGTGAWSTTNNTCATPPPAAPTCSDPVAFYYHHSPDVLAAGVDAFAHWNSNGHLEGRPSCWAPPAGCSLPNPSTQTNAESRTGTQTLACPSGQTGSVTQTRQEQRTQSRSASCPSAYGAFVWGGWSAWSEWTGTTAWATTSNTCAPAGPTCASAAPVVVAFSGNGSTVYRDVQQPPPSPDYVSLPNGWHSHLPAPYAAALSSAKAAAYATWQAGAFSRVTPPLGYPWPGGGYELGGGFLAAVSLYGTCNSAADVGRVAYGYSYRITQRGIGFGDGFYGYDHSWSEHYGLCMSACDAQAYAANAPTPATCAAAYSEALRYGRVSNDQDPYGEPMLATSGPSFTQSGTSCQGTMTTSGWPANVNWGASFSRTPDATVRWVRLN